MDPGSLLIIGSFKKQTVDPDFKVKLLMIAIFSFFSLFPSPKNPINSCELPFPIYDKLRRKSQFVHILQR